jgi:hypothetical protein
LGFRSIRGDPGDCGYPTMLTQLMPPGAQRLPEGSPTGLQRGLWGSGLRPRQLVRVRRGRCNAGAGRRLGGAGEPRRRRVRLRADHSVMRGHRRRRIAKGDRRWTAGRIEQARSQAAPNCANVSALATWDVYRA